MLKKLDAINSKLAKIPSFLWIILLGGSYILKNLWDLLVNSDETLAAVNSYMSQVALEFTGFADDLTWFVYVSTALYGILIFEIILSIVYNYMFRRQYVTAQPLHFKTAARIVFIVANSLSGLFELVGFLNEDFLYYSLYILDFIIYTGAFLTVYFILRESVLNPRWQGSSLRKLYSFYFLFKGFVGVTYMMFALTTEGVALHEKIASSVSLGVIAAAAFLIYRFVMIPALKKERDYIPVPRETHRDDGDSGNSEIFKGYGF